jgi:hypothetical protein
MKAQTMEKQKMVNGVDVDQLIATIEAIKGAPDIAKFQFRITNQWINGGNNHTTITDFYGARQDLGINCPLNRADEHRCSWGRQAQLPVSLLTGLTAA